MTPVLNWIKSNWLIVTFIAIMLIVLPAAFFVSSMMNSGIKRDLEQRISQQANQLRQVSNTQVEILPLTPGAEPISETVTLNRRIVDDYRAIREAVKQDAEAVIQEALRLNRKTGQLVEGLLPAPPPAYAEELPYRLHPAYVEAHERLLAMLPAGAPPDPAMMATQLQEFEQTYRRSQFNAEPGDPLREEDRQKLREAMTEQRLAIYAEQASDVGVYANLSVFNLATWDPSMGKPSPQTMYEWQHTYWVHEDLIRAIAKANTVDGEPATVVGQPGSVVKRIVSIQVDPMFAGSSRRQPGGSAASEFSWGGGPEGGMGFEGGGPEGFRGGGGKGSGMMEAPPPSAPVVADNSDPSQPFQHNFSTSISGQTSNGLFDVRRAKVTLVVDAQRIPSLIAAIHSTNMMTVVDQRLTSIDVYADLAQGYYYGSDPVVQAELTVETIWFRDWTQALMPEEVKTLLGIQTGSTEDAEADEDEG